MNAYTGEQQGQTFADHVWSGRIKLVDGAWYWTEWHVAYAQRPMDTSDNCVTKEEAEALFQKRLDDLRQGWAGHDKRGKFTETPCDRPNGGKAIRFRSVLKNGKPGRLTGILYMDRIVRS